MVYTNGQKVSVPFGSLPPALQAQAQAYAQAAWAQAQAANPGFGGGNFDPGGTFSLQLWNAARQISLTETLPDGRHFGF